MCVCKAWYVYMQTMVCVYAKHGMFACKQPAQAALPSLERIFLNLLLTPALGSATAEGVVNATESMQRR
jgi:hypothetical protein